MASRFRATNDGCAAPAFCNITLVNFERRGRERLQAYDFLNHSVVAVFYYRVHERFRFYDVKSAASTACSTRFQITFDELGTPCPGNP